VDIDGDDGGIPLRHYTWILRNNWWKILAFVAMVTGATAAVTLRMTPIYEATSTLYIDRSEARAVVGQEATNPGISIADNEGYIRSQIELVQSDAVLRPVVDRYRLLAPEEGETEEEAAKRKNAPVRMKNLRVTRRGNTYLLQVQYRDKDPQLAATVANAIAKSYIERNYELRAKTSENAARFLESQLDQVRAKMEQSAEAFAQVEQRLSGVNPDEKTSVLAERLSQLNASYTRSQGERLQAEAAVASIRQGDGGSILASFDQNEAAEFKRLQERQNEVKEQLAQTETVLGPNHPDRRRQMARQEELSRQIEEMRQKLIRQKEVGYDRLRQQEDKLALALKAVKAEYDGLNLAKSEYIRAKREAEQDRLIYEEMVKKIREATINSGFQSNQIRLASEARPETVPVSPSLRLNVVVALLASLLLACGFVIGVDRMDTTVRDPEVMSRMMGVPTIGVLPRTESTPVLPLGAALELPGPATEGSDDGRTPGPAPGRGGKLLGAGAGGPRRVQDRQVSEFDESVRSLREAILAGDLDGKIRSLLVTSANPSEGKSTVAAHLAVAMAEQGHRTLLVECDLRRPSQQRYLGKYEGQGFTDVLNGDLSWRAAARRLRPDLELDVIQAGRASRRAVDRLVVAFPEMLDEMAKDYQLVVVDAPPMLGFPESLRMARMADGVLLVVEAGSTDRRALGTCVANLRQLKAEVVGLVLNGMSRKLGGNYYYYGSYYGRYGGYGYGKRTRYYTAPEDNG
jgi:capsular exopolysaccharide synthesis family protein